MLLRCEFYLRQLFRSQPATLAMVMSLLLLVASAVAFQYCRDLNREAGIRLQEMRLRSVVQPAALRPELVSHAVALPVFVAAEFTEQFSTISRDAHVPTEELFYVLETGTAQPFWRYRITVELKAGYPELRKWIAALAYELPNVALDTIRCHRQDVTSSGLSCQVSFSAFFRKESHG